FPPSSDGTAPRPSPCPEAPWTSRYPTTPFSLRRSLSRLLRPSSRRFLRRCPRSLREFLRHPSPYASAARPRIHASAPPRSSVTALSLTTFRSGYPHV